MLNVRSAGAVTPQIDSQAPDAASSAPAAKAPQMQAPRRYIVKIDDSDKDGSNVYYRAITNPHPGQEIFHGEFAPYQAEVGDGQYTSGFETRYRPVGPITSEPYKGATETF